MYYVCSQEKHRAIKEFTKLKEVVEWINSSGYPELFCSMSRYMLAKEKIYPNSIEGNRKLKEDLDKKHYVVTRTVPTQWNYE